MFLCIYMYGCRRCGVYMYSMIGWLLDCCVVWWGVKDVKSIVHLTHIDEIYPSF